MFRGIAAIFIAFHTCTKVVILGEECKYISVDFRLWKYILNLEQCNIFNRKFIYIRLITHKITNLFKKSHIHI